MSVETYLGFDVGTKKTGVALANNLTNTAQGIQVILHHKNGQTNWTDLDQIITQYNPDSFVVGLPLDDGVIQTMSRLVKSFGSQLIKRYHKPVFYIDEYLSSCEAKSQLKWDYRHKNAKRTEVDKLASSLILQTWLNSQANSD